MSDSDESEDYKKFAESVDTTFFNNKLYNEKVIKEEPKNEIKSQRNLESENIFQSEINISETMKEFISKRLSKLIDDKIEFSSQFPTSSIKGDDEITDTLRLLRGTKEVVKLCHELPEIRTKVPIKRRKVDSDDVKQAEKIKCSAINAEEIVNETSVWHNKTKRQVFAYKSKKGISYLKDSINEFTTCRNKNGWTEAKIKKYKK